MSETKTGTPAPQPMDPALLARLTGGLGDAKTVEKLCSDFGRLYSEFLPDIMHSETGMTVEVYYNSHETGLMSDLIGDLGDNFCFADTSLRNWCPSFTLACGNGFVITLMENLLGALPETIEEPIERPLSDIELDLAKMVFDKIGNVLRSGINAAGGFEPLVEAPHNADNRPKLDDDQVDPYAAAIKMGIDLGSVSSEFVLIVPQKALLKTVVTVPKSTSQQNRDQKQWAEHLSEQVRRSQVTLEARIRLQSLTLGTVSRLAIGDVIAFNDKGEVTVDVNANGKEMYKCEFGRSGENYTVRVKDNISTEDELLKHLMG